jgi:hypothetical protein
MKSIHFMVEALRNFLLVFIAIQSDNYLDKNDDKWRYYLILS